MLTTRDRDEIAKNAQALIRSNTRIGPATCCTLLELWLTYKLELTEDDFDSLVDCLHDHLEKAYDERWRLSPRRDRPALADYESDDDDPTEPG